ncbi:PAS sensor protein [Crinalium epipsammum PCC 9333]|uniref:PAS sensor protein n=1 Tax=Crinalium epipsammum PCC 9333 TaxID=1173022 RepID=K9W4Y3_9CYAN|nr:PAS domain-containing protein [Crinalium epipsammum]AFZ14807.1 PAS sensor protein [Crinalium epipsammum PCC 9333]
MKTIEDMKRETELPVLMTDEQGFIVYVNEPFRQVFGWKNEEIIGQTLAAVIPNSFHDSHNLGFSRFVMTGNPTILSHPLQLKAVKKDGSEIDAEHFILAEENQGQWVFAATLRPLNQ